MVTFLSIPAGLFLLGAILAFCTAAAIFCAFIAVKWQDRRLFLKSLALSMPLTVATAGRPVGWSPELVSEFLGQLRLRSRLGMHNPKNWC